MIIGISGKAQSGKNTICDMISYVVWYYNDYYKYKKLYPDDVENFSYKHYCECLDSINVCRTRARIELHSFAEKLKKSLGAILNVDSSNFENQTFKQSINPIFNLTYRQLLQKFGTAIREGVDSDFWVKVTLQNYNDSKLWLLSDVRFNSEVNGIINKEGYVVRVNRPGAGAGNHISETELDNYHFKYIIENDGTLEDLLHKVKVLCIELDLI